MARACSELSPYLHFGQISPIEVALSARAAKTGGADDKAGFLEELVIRRELAHNFTAFTPDYDRYSCLPAWARATLEAHARDTRTHLYDQATLENGETHDPYWNAAMREMRESGYMHNYMRMYWGKKILEWSPSPEAGYETTLDINNKFFVDGRDANSFANVGWVFGLHDRPWVERPVVRQGALHERQGFGAEVRHQGVRPLDGNPLTRTPPSQDKPLPHPISTQPPR